MPDIVSYLLKFILEPGMILNQTPNLSVGLAQVVVARGRTTTY